MIERPDSETDAKVPLSEIVTLRIDFRSQVPGALQDGALLLEATALHFGYITHARSLSYAPTSER